MKTMITASALILASNVAFAGSLEQWQSHGYDKPATLTEPMRSSTDYPVSLDSWNVGNTDHSSHAENDAMKHTSDMGFVSSLDDLNQGNPDHV